MLNDNEIIPALEDNEIIKALDCCQKEDCYGCSYFHKEECTNFLTKDAFDLINRQKAEIERLETRYEKLLKAKEQIEVETSQEVQSLHREIKTQNNALLAYKEEFERYQSGAYIKLAKAEAVKELLEKIEKQAIPNEDDVYWVELDDIYNIVEEMAGGVDD